MMQEAEQWQQELEAIAGIIRKAPLEVAIKWGAEVFTYEGKNVVSYGGFKNFFSIWFYNGVFLEDKYKVLVAASEGKTKSLRQWRFTAMEEIDKKKILAYIMEAIEVEKKGLKIEPAKFKAIDTPEQLEQAFKTDQLLKKAFDQLSSGKQKEYMIYINEAKQEATKLKRVEKIRPMIMNGVGLNDKYK